MHAISVRFARARCPIADDNGRAADDAADAHAARLVESLQAPEQIEERLAEAPVHEAVRNWITPAGRVGEQMHVRDEGGDAEVLVQQMRLERCNRVDNVQRRPANEKLEHDHEEHLNDALLVLQAFLGVGSVASAMVIALMARDSRDGGLCCCCGRYDDG